MEYSWEADGWVGDLHLQLIPPLAELWVQQSRKEDLNMAEIFFFMLELR